MARRKKTGPKKTRFRPRPGYARVPGRARRYIDLANGEEISRTEYIKRTEHVKSLEAKALMKQSLRDKLGLRHPQARYNAIVREYKRTYGEESKVRGNSRGARFFKDAYKTFIKHTETQAERTAHLEAARDLGIITDAQFERYAEND